MLLPELLFCQGAAGRLVAVESADAVTGSSVAFQVHGGGVGRDAHEGGAAGVGEVGHHHADGGHDVVMGAGRVGQLDRAGAGLDQSCGGELADGLLVVGLFQGSVPQCDVQGSGQPVGTAEEDTNSSMVIPARRRLPVSCSACIRSKNNRWTRYSWQVRRVAAFTSARSTLALALAAVRPGPGPVLPLLVVLVAPVVPGFQDRTLSMMTTRPCSRSSAWPTTRAVRSRRVPTSSAA